MGCETLRYSTTGDTDEDHRFRRHRRRRRARRAAGARRGPPGHGGRARPGPLRPAAPGAVRADRARPVGAARARPVRRRPVRCRPARPQGGARRLHRCPRHPARHGRRRRPTAGRGQRRPGRTGAGGRDVPEPACAAAVHRRGAAGRVHRPRRHGAGDAGQRRGVDGRAAAEAGGQAGDRSVPQLSLIHIKRQGRYRRVVGGTPAAATRSPAPTPRTRCSPRSTTRRRSGRRWAWPTEMGPRSFVRYGIRCVEGRRPSGCGPVGGVGWRDIYNVVPTM